MGNVVENIKKIDELPTSWKMVKTNDGSISLWSTNFDEATHSISGAIAETKHTYLNGCDISKKAHALLPLNILEVGFGTGTGLLVTLQHLQHLNYKSNLTYTALEIDPDIIKWAISNTLTKFIRPDSWKLVESDCCGLTYYKTELIDFNTQICILAGDATITLQQAAACNQFQLPKFDTIYQDPFSPKKNCNLWAVSWFELLKASSSEDVKLSTYSASSRARKSMITAGWTVHSLVGQGHKKEMTQATLTGKTSEAILSRLARSPLDAIY